MAKRPNLLFVFSDQQSWDMLGCYGNDAIKTPRLDVFADRAVRFNHCVSTAPVCTPWRGMLLSGQHPLHNGAVFNDWQMRPGNGQYLAEVLRDAGYRCGWVGKWHLYGGRRDRPVPPGPLRYGFDDRFLTNNCTLEYRAGRSWYWDESGARRCYDKWEPDAQTDQAIAFLDESADDDRPFALFVSWHPPHNWTCPSDRFPRRWTYEAPEQWMDLYGLDDVQLRPGAADTEEQRQIYRGHYALCSNLDHNFGRLLDRLDQLAMTDQTLTVYTSDHGDTLRSVPGEDREHKRQPVSTSCRVPMLMAGPGLTARASELIFSGLDMMPTLLGALGVDPSASCHGRDLSDAIARDDDDAVDETPLFLASDDRIDWRGLYTRRYTYSFGVEGDRFNKLFDRADGAYELVNHFDDPDYADVQADLHARAVGWMERFGDRFVPFEKILNRCLNAPPTDGELVHTQEDATTRGRPVDLLDGVPGLLDQQ